MPCRFVYVCGLLPLLCGCRVDQDRETSAYRAVLDAPGLRPTTGPAGTISLPQLLRLANRASDDLALQGETYYRVLNERRRAVADFLPTVDLVPTYARRDVRGGSGRFVDRVAAAGGVRTCRPI